MERFVKKVNDWKLLNGTRKALRLRCSTRFLVCLCYPGRKWEYTDHVKQWLLSEAYSESYKTSKIERFAEIVNGFRPLTILGKRSFLDFWQGFEFVSWFCILCCVSFHVHCCSSEFREYHNCLHCLEAVSFIVANYFHKKASSYLFNWILSTSLLLSVVILGQFLYLYVYKDTSLV